MPDTPVIGILSQEPNIVEKYFPGERHDSFIAASYVKYLESAGARVIPIWIGQNEEYYRRVVNYTNGILFPGGGTYFGEPGGYGEAAKKIYKLAVQANKDKAYYPVWGTCLGFQVLGFADYGEDIRINCSMTNKAVPLDFAEDFESSKLFLNAPKDILNTLNSKNVTFNYHKFCLTKAVLKEKGILPNWRILATNRDESNLQFISAMESVDYPIYGVQFHPEKNQFEFEITAISHTSEAIKISQYFANFFVEECRKSKNSFPNKTILKKALIYNYNPRYTGLTDVTYEQVYVFNKSDFRKVQLK